MIELRTDRIRLVALTAWQLRLFLADQRQLESELGYSISRSIVYEPVPRAIHMKLAMMEAIDPDTTVDKAEETRPNHLWLTYWLIVIIGEAFGAGLIGFKGRPDDRGQVEIGYGIDAAYRNQGYTTEAVEALIAWAFQAPECRAVIAPGTYRSNIASNRVLAKVGMRVCAETPETVSWRIEKVAR
jgi:RimJ/RimL family protein N-acetyltransferase